MCGRHKWMTPYIGHALQIDFGVPDSFSVDLSFQEVHPNIFNTITSKHSFNFL